MNPRRSLLRVTRGGVLFLALAIQFASVGVVLCNNFLFVVGCLMAGILVAAAVGALLNVRGLEVRRRLPFPLFAGTTCHCAVTIVNRRIFLPAALLFVRDRVREDLVARVQAVATPAVHVGWVPPGGTAQSRHPMRFFKHGRVTFQAVELVSTFPLGLFRVMKTVPAPDTAVVYPRLRPVPAWLVPDFLAPARGCTARRGEEEFAGLREFRPGDSPKLIHWRSSARVHDRLLVKELESLTERRVAIVFDARLRRVDVPSRARFVRAVSVAASLTRELVGRRYAVDVLIRTGEGTAPFTVARHDSALFQLFHALAVLEPSADGRGGDEAPYASDVPTMVIRPDALVPRKPLEAILRWR